jgi:hypothetical protein
MCGANAKVLFLFLHRLIEPFRLLLGLVTIPASVVLTAAFAIAFAIAFAVAFAIAPTALSLTVLTSVISLTSLLSLSPAAILLVAVATFRVLIALTITSPVFRKAVIGIFLLVGLAWSSGLAQCCPVAATFLLARGLGVSGLLAVAETAGTRTLGVFATSGRLCGRIGSSESAAGRESCLWGAKYDVVCNYCQSVVTFFRSVHGSLTTALGDVGSRLHQAWPLTCAEVAHGRGVAIVARSRDSGLCVFGGVVFLGLQLLWLRLGLRARLTVRDP